MRKKQSNPENAAYQKKRYWERRMAVIAFLGGKCQHRGCNCTDVSLLEIHHVEPILYSVKGNGNPRGPRSGESRIREWDDIIAGKVKAKLFCREHHRHIAHKGNPCMLKKKKVK